MAGVDLALSVECRQLLHGLGEAAKRGRDLQPVWAEAGEILLKSVRQNFEAGGRPATWQPLRASTLLSKAGGARKAKTKSGKFTKRAQRIIGGNKVLVASGRLLNSVTYVVTARGVIIGSSLVYAATHQFGRSSGRGAPIPARPFLAVQPEDEHAIAAAISKYLIEPLQRAA